MLIDSYDLTILHRYLMKLCICMVQYDWIPTVDGHYYTLQSYIYIFCVIILITHDLPALSKQNMQVVKTQVQTVVHSHCHVFLFLFYCLVLNVFFSTSKMKADTFLLHIQSLSSVSLCTLFLLRGQIPFPLLRHAFESTNCYRHLCFPAQLHMSDAVPAQVWKMWCFWNPPTLDPWPPHVSAVHMTLWSGLARLFERQRIKKANNLRLWGFQLRARNHLSIWAVIARFRIL